MPIPYLKQIRTLARGAVILVCADVVVVIIVSGSYWQIGNAKLYANPKWTGYKPEQIQKIIADREPLLSSVRRMFELKGDVTKDPTLMDVIADDCVLDNPLLRCVGKQEIYRHFRILPNDTEKLRYTEFKPTHHPNRIEIRCSRIEKKVYSSEFNLLSTLVVQLTKDDVPKASSITDEWNSVDLFQPQTHNKYLFSGSMARLLRRAMAQMNFARHSDNPYWFNIFYWKREFHRKKRELLSKDRKADDNDTERRTDFPEGTNVFNAGRKSE